MKKLFKTALAMVCVFALGIVNIPVNRTAKAKEVENVCMGGMSISVSCKQTDEITFTSDDTGMTYMKTGYSSISIGGQTTYSASFSVYFSTAGEHTLTLLVNGIEAETKTYNVFASHSWGNGTVKTKATCTKEGKIEYTCENCGQKKTETIEKTQHKYQLISQTKANCHRAGSKWYSCSYCHNSYKETIPQTTHSWGDWYVAKKATIFKAGEERQKCKNCTDVNKRKIGKLSSFVTLKKKTLKLKKGKKATLKIKKKTSGDSIKSFRSSKKSVATVTKAGKVTAKKKGTTKITLTMKSGCKATCKVVVK